jgi:hypothetical protein
LKVEGQRLNLLKKDSKLPLWMAMKPTKSMSLW